MTAGTWPRRRRVAQAEEEEEDFFFSLLPKLYLGSGWLQGRAAGPARWAALGKTLPLFFLLRFLFLLLHSFFVDLNSNLNSLYFAGLNKELNTKY
jgi:hypothetical protein